MNKFEKGMKVHYAPIFGYVENGIVKDFNDNEEIAWVVFHCWEQWDRYEDYTGCATSYDELEEGWA